MEEDGLDRVLLEVGWVAVFVEDALHHHFDFGAGALAQGPVDGHAFLDLRDELRGDDLQLLIPHRYHGGFVGGERVVEGDLIVGQAENFATLGCSVQLLGELDELFDYFLRCDGAVVIRVQCLL